MEWLPWVIAVVIWTCMIIGGVTAIASWRKRRLQQIVEDEARRSADLKASREERQQAVQAHNIPARVEMVILSRIPDVTDAQIKPEANLSTDLLADSLDVVDLVIGLEDEFGIHIPDEVAEKLRTVDDVIGCIEELMC